MQRFGENEPVFYVSAGSRSNLELKPGERRTGVDFSLTRSLAIEGRVLDHLDQPMANVEVAVQRADGRFVPVRESVTNDVGGYRLYGLIAGRYRVCAAVEGPDAGLAADGTRFVRTCHTRVFTER